MEPCVTNEISILVLYLENINKLVSHDHLTHNIIILTTFQPFPSIGGGTYRLYHDHDACEITLFQYQFPPVQVVDKILLDHSPRISHPLLGCL